MLMPDVYRRGPAERVKASFGSIKPKQIVLQVSMCNLLFMKENIKSHVLKSNPAAFPEQSAHWEVMPLCLRHVYDILQSQLHASVYPGQPDCDTSRTDLSDLNMTPEAYGALGQSPLIKIGAI